MNNRAVAARYARALFEVSRDSGDVEKTEQDVLSFQQILDGHDTLKNALLDPAISVVNKRGLVTALLAKMQLSAVASRLLLMLADRDRLELLPEISESYNALQWTTLVWCARVLQRLNHLTVRIWNQWFRHWQVRQAGKSKMKLRSTIPSSGEW